MPRVIVWHCDNCDRESRSESASWLVVKEFGVLKDHLGRDKPKFYSFCSWQCLSAWLSEKRTPDRAGVKQK